MTDPTSLPQFPVSGGSGGSGTPLNGTSGDGTPVRDKVFASLQAEGFRPEIDADGDISYKVEGQQLFVRVVEGMPAMMRVFGQWQIAEELPQDLTRHLLAANDVTLSLNIIKAGIANGTLVVTGEHLAMPDTDVSVFVPSTTQMVLQAVQLWHSAVTSDGPHAATADPSEAGDVLPDAQNLGDPNNGPQG